jgi:hypothetical protein
MLKRSEGAVELGIPRQVDAYGLGTPQPAILARELHRALPGIMRAFKT